MLDKLLRLLRSGGTRTVAELARELETSVPLVQMMVEELTRLGYLAPAGAGHPSISPSPGHSGRCSEGCAGCRMTAPCVVGESTRVWTLTDRG